jgi:hypothetical protein
VSLLEFLYQEADRRLSPSRILELTFKRVLKLLSAEENRNLFSGASTDYAALMRRYVHSKLMSRHIDRKNRAPWALHYIDPEPLMWEAKSYRAQAMKLIEGDTP